MADDALIAWLDSGGKPSLSAEEQAARQAREFAARFLEAISPQLDLGETEEIHQAAVAANVFAVHADLNPLGEVAYSDVWALLGAPQRKAIKHYVDMHSQRPRAVSGVPAGLSGGRGVGS